MIQCEECGKELSSEFGEMPRLPCPDCNSIGRKFSMFAGGGRFTIRGGHVSLIHTRPGLNSTAQADDQGRVKLTVTGSSPKNEDDALNICARLVRVLNGQAGHWTAPNPGEQDVDGYSTNSDGHKFNMQVIRASHSPALWEELTKYGSACSESIASDVAKDMIAAVLKKSVKYPSAQKKELTLILDAARTPIYTFQRVIDEFKNNHLLECQNAGFQQVWVVGPQDSIVERIDV